MNLFDFNENLEKATDDAKLLDFCRKHVLHGTPYVFLDREDEYYEFRKCISEEFGIPFHEVYITGSGKLGFSPFKEKKFDYDSDIDVSIISLELYDWFLNDISKFQYELRESRRKIHANELEMYHEFLEYTALGWIRPDKLPVSFQMKGKKTSWFKFFESISFGKSSVGDYKVTAGVFKSYSHLEAYISNGLSNLKKKQLAIKQRQV